MATSTKSTGRTGSRRGGSQAKAKSSTSSASPAKNSSSRHEDCSARYDGSVDDTPAIRHPRGHRCDVVHAAGGQRGRRAEGAAHHRASREHASRSAEAAQEGRQGVGEQRHGPPSDG